MRNIAALTLFLLLPVSAFAYSPKQPEHHKRYSPNTQFFVDFNPETDRHTLYAANTPDESIWSFESDAFWPYKKDESDGCLFVANDGATIAGPTWVHWTGHPPDYRTFDGLEFWNANGKIAGYRVSELPSWRLKILDFPVRIVWMAIDTSGQRGRNLIRQEDELHAKTFGMRSFTFSLTTGEVTGWNLNVNYFAYFILVYGLPVWFLAGWINRRRRGLAASTTQRRNPVRGVLVNNAGVLLVVLNGLAFMIGVFLGSFGGTLDHIGAHFCRLSYPIAFVLVPVTLAISAAGLTSLPRRLDILGPWLAIMSVAVLVAIVG